jgi:hypothetical protein
MSQQVIKKYKGEKAAQRGITEMQHMGYEVDQASTRKAMYSLATGVFTRKQIHTIVFRKTEAAQRAEPVLMAPALRFLVESTDLSISEINEVRKARGVDIDQLAELYRAGQVPELDEAAQSAEAVPEPTQAVGSVADELAKLAALRDSGVLSEDEFQAQKTKLLAG